MIGTDLTKRIYNSIVRPWLPTKISVHNGIPVQGRVRLLDQNVEFPDYEEALVSAIRKRVDRGNQVVIVGGGIGVSTVVAAQRAMSSASVSVFEGSRNQFAILNRTIKLNQLTEYCTTHHATIGADIGVYGDQGNADIVNPEKLPECDVLVMDCEGAELEILEELASKPDEIIVETHAYLNTPENKVREALIDRGYKVVNRTVEDETKGVYILTAVKV